MMVKRTIPLEILQYFVLDSKKGMEHIELQIEQLKKEVSRENRMIVGRFDVKPLRTRLGRKPSRAMQKVEKQQNRLNRKAKRFYSRISRLELLLDEYRERYKLAVFGLGLIPSGWSNNAKIVEKLEEDGDLRFHVYIDIENDTERIFNREHGHVILDFQGRIYYARYPGESRGVGKHFRHGILAEEYINHRIKTEKVIDYDSPFMLQLYFSYCMNDDFSYKTDEAPVI